MPEPVVAPTVPQAPNPSEPAAPVAPAPQAPAQEPEVDGSVELFTKEDIAALNDVILKEGDGFVYKIPESETFYRGQTRGEVIQQILKGIAEKEKFIASNKPRLARPQVPLSRQTPPQTPSAPQAPEDGGPIPPDEAQIRQRVYDGMLKETGLDPKYLRLSNDAQEWRDLEIELGAVRASNIYQEKREFERKYGERVKAELGRENTYFFNQTLGNEAVDDIYDWLQENKIELDQATFDRLLDESYQPDNAWTSTQRLLPTRVVLNFQKAYAKMKPASPAPPSPLRTSIEGDKLRNLPPGVTTLPAAPAPPAAPNKDAPKNREEAFERVKQQLQTK